MKGKYLHPEIIVAVAAGLWGLFWLPLRALAELGLEPSWSTAAQFITPMLLLLPAAVLRRLQGKSTGLSRFDSGLLVGGGIGLYMTSLLLTDVARALILFYVMPAWGTMVEVGLMGRRFSRWRGLALLLSFGGLFAILNAGGTAELALNTGDLLALLSGIIFTFGAMRVRQTADAPVFAQIFAYFFYGSIVALAIALLPLPVLGRPPDLPSLVRMLPWLLITAVSFLIPVMSALYWGFSHVDPGRLGILLQLEAVMGIGSAFLLAGEPFGLAEISGSLLVIGAGLVEVLGNRGNEQTIADVDIS